MTPVATMRTASPPAPPADWLERLRDLVMVKNLLNGDSVAEGPDTPVAHRLREFLDDPVVSEAWQKFNQGRPRL